jgi:hypothetical protein
MARTQELTRTPADILKYQSELVRTGKSFPLGRMQKISIGPAAGYVAPPADPYIRKFGRLIDLRDRFLPIAQSPDKSMILVTAPLVDRNNRVQLPDVPDPDWTPAGYTGEELERAAQGQEITLAMAERAIAEAQAAGNTREVAKWRAAAQNVRDGFKVSMPVERPIEKDLARMIPQRLEDRTNEILEGTQFLVFSPVINVAFQPEIERRLVGTAWTLQFGYNPADGTHPSLLIDRQTGETHFFGGLYDIFGPSGE